jgi:hypothetical protein
MEQTFVSCRNSRRYYRCADRLEQPPLHPTRESVEVHHVQQDVVGPLQETSAQNHKYDKATYEVNSKMSYCRVNHVFITGFIESDYIG